MSNNKNLACRIFKEQIDLIQQLPENERAEVLYKAILSAFNQIENQNDIQIENQNEYAYVSVSDSVSVLSKTVYSLLEKNIVCKEFSNNYGGRRIGAGRPVKEPEKPIPIPQPEPKQPVPTPPKDFIPPTLEEVLEYAREQNNFAGCGGFACTPEQAEEFWSYYESQGWRIGNDSNTPIRDWKPKLRQWNIKAKQMPINQFGQRVVKMTAKEIKEAENHMKLQKMLNGEL